MVSTNPTVRRYKRRGGCVSEFGARGLTAWVRRLDETDEVDKRRLEQNSSLRILYAVALSETSKDVLETQKPKAVDSPRPVEDGQRVIARPEDDKQLSVSAGEA